jgi:DNA-binding transcriptional MerR regulator
MDHSQRTPLSTTVAVARAAGCSENWVRALADRGVVHPQRDSSGRRLFSAEDVAQIREYVAQRQRRAL